MSWSENTHPASEDDVVVGRVKDTHGWYGNMAPYPVTYQNLDYRTTEALFQCLRVPGDEEVRELIRAEKGPMQAKLAAQKYADRRTVVPLSEDDLDNMRVCLRLKVAQHYLLREWLLQTGERFIVEDCTRRQRGTGLFWGSALIEGEWRGMNWLGVLWMEYRKELQAQESLFDEITGG
jgi:N-glycosidase YbiA